MESKWVSLLGVSHTIHTNGVSHHGHLNTIDNRFYIEAVIIHQNYMIKTIVENFLILETDPAI